MKILKVLALLTALVASSASANNSFAADGFIGVSKPSYKMAESGVFVYCDKPDAYKKECSDIMIRGAQGISGENQSSKWRTADEYLKYKLNENFSYVGMSAISHGVVLYYKLNPKT
jgi:hypothetical protein